MLPDKMVAHFAMWIFTGWLLCVYSNRHSWNENTSSIVQVPCHHFQYIEPLVSNSSICDYRTGAQRLQCDPLYQRSIGQALGALVAWGGFTEISVIYTKDFSIHLLLLQKHIFKLSCTLKLVYLDSQYTVSDVESSVSASSAVITLTDTLTAQQVLSKISISKSSTWLVVTSEEAFVNWDAILHEGDRVMLIVANATPPNPVCMGNQIVLPLWIHSMASGNMGIIGTYSSQRGRLRISKPDPWSITTFTNRKFKIAITPLPVFHYKTEINGSMVWTGICIEMLHTLSKMLNFSFELVEPPDSKWGAPNGDGTWNGMVGQVYRKEVDFAVGKFTITQIRDSVIDYADPFWHEPAVMVMRKDEPETLLLFLGPFQWKVWVSLIASLPVMAIALVVTLYLERLWWEPNTQSTSQLVADTVWLLYGAMLCQGSSWLPSKTEQASRVLISIWLFFNLVIVATYTGNLIAVLAVPKIPIPVETLDELSQSSYQYGAMDGSALGSLFELSTNPTYQHMWSQSMSNQQNKVINHAEGLKRVKGDGNYIYIVELSGVAAVAYTDCNYTLGKEEFFPSSFAWVFPENSPLIPVFNERFNILIENGFLNRWRLKFYPRDGCSKKKQDTIVAATLSNTQGAFIALAVGIFLSFISLTYEIIIGRYMSRKANKKRKAALDKVVLSVTLPTEELSAGEVTDKSSEGKSVCTSTTYLDNDTDFSTPSCASVRDRTGYTYDTQYSHS